MSPDTNRSRKGLKQLASGWQWTCKWANPILEIWSLNPIFIAAAMKTWNQ